MPDRVIRSSILTSDRVNALSWPAEVFYRRLMSVVDDFGRFDGRPGIIRAALYPLKLDTVNEPDVGKWLRECEKTDLVRGYEVERKLYLQIMRFDQRLRAMKSKWPPPPESAVTCQQVSAVDGHRLTNASESESETESETRRNPTHAPVRGEDLPGLPIAAALARGPTVEIIRKEPDCHVPTVEEVIAFGAMGAAIPEHYCLHYHERKEITQSWITGQGKMVLWRKEIMVWFNRDGRPMQPRQQSQSNAPRPTAHGLKTQIEAIEQERRKLEMKGARDENERPHWHDQKLKLEWEVHGQKLKKLKKQLVEL